MESAGCRCLLLTLAINAGQHTHLTAHRCQTPPPPACAAAGRPHSGGNTHIPARPRQTPADGLSLLLSRAHAIETSADAGCYLFPSQVFPLHYDLKCLNTSVLCTSQCVKHTRGSVHEDVSVSLISELAGDGRRDHCSVSCLHRICLVSGS